MLHSATAAQGVHCAPALIFVVILGKHVPKIPHTHRTSLSLCFFGSESRVAYKCSKACNRCWALIGGQAREQAASAPTAQSLKPKATKANKHCMLSGGAHKMQPSVTLFALRRGAIASVCVCMKALTLTCERLSLAGASVQNICCYYYLFAGHCSRTRERRVTLCLYIRACACEYRVFVCFCVVFATCSH